MGYVIWNILAFAGLTFIVWLQKTEDKIRITRFICSYCTVNLCVCVHKGAWPVLFLPFIWLCYQGHFIVTNLLLSSSSNIFNILCKIKLSACCRFSKTHKTISDWWVFTYLFVFVWVHFHSLVSLIVAWCLSGISISFLDDFGDYISQKITYCILLLKFIACIYK